MKQSERWHRQSGEMPAPSLAHEVSKQNEVNKQPPGAWGYRPAFKTLVGCFPLCGSGGSPCVRPPPGPGSCPCGAWAQADGARWHRAMQERPSLLVVFGDIPMRPAPCSAPASGLGHNPKGTHCPLLKAMSGILKKFLPGLCYSTLKALGVLLQLFPPPASLPSERLLSFLGLGRAGAAKPPWWPHLQQGPAFR